MGLVQWHCEAVVEDEVQEVFWGFEVFGLRKRQNRRVFEV